LAACHLLLYVVYLCQKSLNFVYALICYKQKCKVVSLNLAHPVDVASPTETRAWKKESGGIQVVWPRLPPYSRCLSGACDLWVQIKVQDSRMQLRWEELEVHFRVWL